MSTPSRHASNCKFARPTIEESGPAWLSAEDQPWTCHRLAEPHPIDDTERCADCPHWEPRTPEPTPE